MLISELTPMSEPVRRVEIFTGHGRRRTWSAQDKAAIVAESYGEGESVCGVARRHGLTPQQVFTWRRQARLAQEPANERVAFVPAVLDTSVAQSSVTPQRSLASQREGAGIEVELGGAVVRIGPHASETAITAVIRALRSPT
jgi:transposase